LIFPPGELWTVKHPTFDSNAISLRLCRDTLTCSTSGSLSVSLIFPKN
jgi:hypothetical protein